MHDLSTTVAAVATAPGRGGIGCVRLSGPDAVRIAAGLCHGDREPPTEDARARFVIFLDRAGRAIDHGYVIAFPPSRSFTGEPSVELWAHGSPPVLDGLVEGALDRGAKLAAPGEFTYRALRHGRLDLARAEAIRDLVAATTAYQARVAFSQLQGAVARRVAPLRDDLVDLIARAEAAIEFSDESETHLEAGRLSSGVDRTLAEARRLVAEARRGRLVQRGARVALVGATSVGKSSLFNRLLGVERAIVSPIPGTTRDTIEEPATLEGMPLVLVDTAGLRPPEGPVEAEGVRRARAAAAAADLSLIVLDASRALDDDERSLLSEAVHGGRPTIVVANKSDLQSARDAVPESIPVSALTGDGLPRLREAILEALRGAPDAEDPAITDLRQAKALDDAVLALERAREAVPLGDEIVVEELRSALAAIGAVTGEVAAEELYDRIFSTFCIGK